MDKLNINAIIQSIVYHTEVMLEEYPRAWNICLCPFCSSRLLQYVQGITSVKKGGGKSDFFKIPTVTQFTSIELLVQSVRTLTDNKVHYSPRYLTIQKSHVQKFVDKADKISRSLTSVS